MVGFRTEYYWINNVDLESGKPTVQVWVFDNKENELRIRTVPANKLKQFERELRQQKRKKVKRRSDLPVNQHNSGHGCGYSYCPLCTRTE